MGRPVIEWEEHMGKVTKKGNTLTGGDQAGEGQESVPELAGATCRLNGQQGKRRRKKNYLPQTIKKNVHIYIYLYIQISKIY